MRSRLTAVLLALFVGATAVIAVNLYVRGIEDRANRGQETRPVVVATRFLPAGTSGDAILEAGAIELQTVPRNFAEPGALESIESLAGLTLADDIAAGEQVTSHRFRQTESDAFLSEFPRGTEALTLPLDFVRGVAGHLQSGSTVNAYVTTDAKKATAEILARASKATSKRFFDPDQSGATILLLKNLLVVEVQEPAVTTTGAAAVAPTMTLAVTPVQGALLIHSQERAKLWFTLVPEDAR